MELKVKRIHEAAKLPRYGHKGDAGLDLFSSTSCVLAVGEVKAVPTGIQMAIPEGYVGLIWDKSGISLGGVHRFAGVVDSGYRGELKVVMANLGEKGFHVEAGMKIAQLLIQQVQEVTVIDVAKLEDTSRGQNGFGSTGKF
ncbi:MAG: dUTP diphosphatase [Candidatus Aminicenantes bacterium]|nr:dUTP diphosphatase [Candidatus Aminicenantes bacterium]